MIKIFNILDVKYYIKDVEVVVFDLDDTLYSEKEYVKSGYNEVAKHLSQVKDAEIKLWKYFEAEKYAIDELLTSENIYSEELKNKCLQIYRNQTPKINLYSGVYELLTSLKEQGYKLGMITDGVVERQKAKIKALNIEKLFDKIIITDELGGVEYRKPNAKSYEIMRDYFNVDYGKMVYVADNLNKDFIAPIKLGIKQIHFENLDGLYLKK